MNTIINSVKPKQANNISFGQGQINVLATSDNHGQINSMDAFYSNTMSNLDKIFPKKEDKSTLNIGAIAGDWFINPNRKNFLTDPTKTAGDFQLDFLNKFVSSVRKKVPNFKLLYVPGNHCFDGGDKYLVDHLKKADLTTVLSNANLNSSAVLNNLTPEERNKIKQYTVLEVPDDKDPKKTHKALVLGITMMGVDFYTPGLAKGTDVIDRIDQKDINIKETDLKQTYKTLGSLINEFKKENPKGAVMVMSHTGNNISEMIAKNVPNIDVILNGHDHVDKETFIQTAKEKQTHIISLWNDNKKLNAVKIHFDDNGNFDNKDESSKAFYSKDAPMLENNPFKRLFEKSFKEDQKPILKITAPEGISKLGHENVRYENNLLANLVTDGILTSLKKHMPDVEIFGVFGATFRQGLPTDRKANNIEIMNVLNGCIEDFSKVYVGEIKGSDIAEMVTEYVQDNMINKDRNPLIQWSGVQIDETKVLSAAKSGKEEEIKQAIKIKNNKGEYEPIDLQKTYKTALPKELFVVPNVKTAVRLENKFVSTDMSMGNLFVEYLKDNNYNINVPDPNDIRVKI